MKHRTALITAGSIGAVVLAGAIAVGANLGILTFADSAPVGQLSPGSVAQTPATAPAPAPVVAAAPAQQVADSQKYIIKQAGSLEVAFSKHMVRLVDVSPKRHWTWTLTQTVRKKLTLTFQHLAATYTFVAHVDRHGRLTVRVDHPVTRLASAPAVTAAPRTVWVSNPAPRTRVTRAAVRSSSGDGSGRQTDSSGRGGAGDGGGGGGGGGNGGSDD
jgi:hypothetical protein